VGRGLRDGYCERQRRQSSLECFAPPAFPNILKCALSVRSFIFAEAPSLGTGGWDN
jgi:hypothetical protein